MSEVGMRGLCLGPPQQALCCALNHQFHCRLSGQRLMTSNQPHGHPPEAMAASTASCSWSGSGTSSRPEVLASPLRSAAWASASAAASGAVGLVGLSGCVALGLAGCLRAAARFRPAGDLGLSMSIGPAGGGTPRLPAPAAVARSGSRGWLALTTCRGCRQEGGGTGVVRYLAALHAYRYSSSVGSPCTHASATLCPAHPAYRQHTVEHDWLAALALHGHWVHAIFAVPQLRRSDKFGSVRRGAWWCMAGRGAAGWTWAPNRTPKPSCLLRGVQLQHTIAPHLHDAACSVAHGAVVVSVQIFQRLQEGCVEASRVHVSTPTSFRTGQAVPRRRPPCSWVAEAGRQHKRQAPQRMARAFMRRRDM